VLREEPKVVEVDDGGNVPGGRIDVHLRRERGREGGREEREGEGRGGEGGKGINQSRGERNG